MVQIAEREIAALQGGHKLQVHRQTQATWSPP